MRTRHRKPAFGVTHPVLANIAQRAPVYGPCYTSSPYVFGRDQTTVAKRVAVAQVCGGVIPRHCPPNSTLDPVCTQDDVRKRVRSIRKSDLELPVLDFGDFDTALVEVRYLGIDVVDERVKEGGSISYA